MKDKNVSFFNVVIIMISTIDILCLKFDKPVKLFFTGI